MWSGALAQQDVWHTRAPRIFLKCYKSDFGSSCGFAEMRVTYGDNILPFILVCESNSAATSINCYWVVQWTTNAWGFSTVNPSLVKQLLMSIRTLVLGMRSMYFWADLVSDFNTIRFGLKVPRFLLLWYKIKVTLSWCLSCIFQPCRVSQKFLVHKDIWTRSQWMDHHTPMMQICKAEQRGSAGLHKPDLG